MENYDKLKQVIQVANPSEMVQIAYEMGREIRLADVLLAIPLMELQTLLPKSEEMPTGCTRLEHLVHNLWNLKDDNLDHQSDETKQFLIHLLVE